MDRGLEADRGEEGAVERTAARFVPEERGLGLYLLDRSVRRGGEDGAGRAGGVSRRSQSRLHRHREVEIDVVTAGACRFVWEDGRAVVVSAGEAVACRGDGAHRVEAERDATVRGFWIAPEALPGFAPETPGQPELSHRPGAHRPGGHRPGSYRPGAREALGLSGGRQGALWPEFAPGPIRVAREGAFLARLGALWELAAEASGRVGSEEESGHLAALAGIAWSRGPWRSPDGAGAGAEERVAAVRAAMERRPERATSVSDLADAAGLSPSRFGATFRAMYGVGPWEHLVRARLARAAEMLREGSRPVGEIAAEAGFASVANFHARFSARYGVSPRAYRAGGGGMGGGA